MEKQFLERFFSFSDSQAEMSQAVPSACGCPTPISTNVPGPQGSNGAPGTDGANAFSTVQTDFVVPAISASVTVTVDSNKWMVIGQNVFVFDAGYFEVNSLSGTTAVGLTYLDYVGNTATGNTIAAGAQISPAGTQGDIPDPVPVANGGTDATTKGGAQTNLGLGQNATVHTGAALGYGLTTTPTEITGMAVTAPAAGLYLVLAYVTVDYAGVTFASSRAVTLATVNSTQSATIATCVKNTQVQTTANFPSFDYCVPIATTTLAAADIVQIQISIAVVPSAGTAVVSAASLAIIPLALS